MPAARSTHSIWSVELQTYEYLQTIARAQLFCSACLELCRMFAWKILIIQRNLFVYTWRCPVLAAVHNFVFAILSSQRLVKYANAKEGGVDAEEVYVFCPKAMHQLLDGLLRRPCRHAALDQANYVCGSNVAELGYHQSPCNSIAMDVTTQTLNMVCVFTSKTYRTRSSDSR